MPERIAVVAPRFGAGVIGGAEALLREIAIGLAERGWAVEVLTTCATDHFSWANDLPEGTEVVDGLPVTRFPTVSQHAPGGLRAQQKIQVGELPTYEEQVSWLSWRFSVPGLFDHLLRHGDEYGAVLFAPYLFWTTTVCLPLVADRAISMPCLHDETYARLDVVAPALSEAARIWFLSEPEHRVAHRIRPLSADHRVVGAGMATSGSYDGDRFRERHGIRRPFLLYAGRREEGKGWDWLLETYAGAVTDHGMDLDLVSIGVGELAVPPAVRRRVIDLGVVSDAERDDAVAAATAIVQPSLMESFSRTVMEAWLAGTPVLVRAGSEVVTWHVDRSGGGLVFADGGELARAAAALTSGTDQARTMGAKGRAYVLENYSWPVVLERLEADLVAMGLTSGGPPVAPGAPATAAAPARTTLVVGSFPPVPTPAAEAALNAARQALAAGDEVTTASPRPSAARYTLAVAGPLAGRRLAQLRAATGATRLVLCVEPEVPIPVSGYPAWALSGVQQLSARFVSAEMARFEDVTLVRVGDPGVPPAVWSTLSRVATRVVDHRPSAPAPPGVTALGPTDPPVREVLRSVAAAVDRRLLRRSPRARRVARSALRRVLPAR